MKTGHQRGGNSGTFMIPINKYPTFTKENEKTVELKLVSPSQQIVNQAKEEVEDKEKDIKKKKRKRKISNSHSCDRGKTSTSSKKKKSEKKIRRDIFS